MKFEIKHRFSGIVLFSLETELMRCCAEAAIKSGAELAAAYLAGADLHGADLADADLHGADLHGACLAEADLRRADLRRADLGGADLHRANLADADLHGADLHGACLTEADLHGADLGGADLHRANLADADLGGADLHGADLADADLHGADLHGADLADADLHGADLHGADLRRAYLAGADLHGANLAGANGYNQHLTDPLLMLKDQVGKIRAYKLVKPDGLAPFNGGITYETGKSYEVKDASTDENEPCSRGINLATLPWCMHAWQIGYRILVAEFTADDIACIPLRNDGKFRVFRCRIVGEKDLVEIGLVEKQP